MIADADPLARRAIRDALHKDRAFTVIADASNGAEAVELALHHLPSLVLMETALPRVSGIEATTQIVARAPQVRVVLFSVEATPELELRGLRAGASGFLSKDIGVDGLAQAMLGVIRGEAAVSRALTMRLIRRLREVPDLGRGIRPVHSVLTTREWQVLDLMSAGGTTAEIARRLRLTEETVYSHIKHIMRKLGVHSRDEAIAAGAHSLLMAPRGRAGGA